MSEKKVKTIGWAIVIVGIIFSFIIGLRETIFNGHPINTTNFFSSIIIACVSIAGFFFVTEVITKEKKA